jgi:hypothetical protein
MQATSDFVGGAAERGEVVRLQEAEAFLRGEAFADDSFGEDIGVGSEGDHNLLRNRLLVL